ncbi:hypothetical protein C4K00_3836 [Pseudomonas synxantha]|uniref:aminotransferase-like domain-containing protein n=1 Tax=Pseudomonas synxantha TaxID=47883 RepID=UPI000F58C1FE|nr:PLP-dependent aminotransferase family protein [Pseudomonas synxantha]AZE74049.1 hypothetical protein C4K00_3836 [Pseudomonas synxantha]
MKRSKDTFAYQAVYRYLIELIEACPADGERKLPSLRLGVSVSTTKYAYALLEEQGRIQARPKLGFFIAPGSAAVINPSSSPLLDQVFANARQPGMLALSSDAPAMLLSLEQPLLMLERELTRRYPRSLAPLYLPMGEPELRAALAERYSRSTEHYWQADQVYIGSDLHSVLEVSLNALELAGTLALVESPCSWAILRQLQAAKIRVIEMPLGADGRFDLDALSALFKREPIRLAVLSSTVNMPQGGVVPSRDKQQICQWLAERDIWLFENDTYGELYFGPQPARYRDYADPQKLLVFSTFDKVIGSEAPYGYVLCRSAGAPLQRLFLERGFRLSPIRQKAIARLFTTQRFDAHLKALRALLLERMTQLKALLHAHGDDLWRVAAPHGGASFWLEATRPVQMRQVFAHLLSQRIVIAPGELFSQQGAWSHHLRLSYTLDWSKDITQAVQLLAQALRQSP